jgi:hypothetical protein
MRDTFAGRGAVNYGDIGEVERRELNAKVWRCRLTPGNPN